MAYKKIDKAHQFKKGTSGNPLGGKLHNPAIKALRNITVDSYRQIIELALTGNVAGLREVAKDGLENKASKYSAVQVGVATAILKAISRGDDTVIERLASRIIGKLPDKLDVGYSGSVEISFADKAKLKRAILELEADV